MLAAQCDGAKVETIEGVSDAGEIADLQAAFEQRNALQCGFCTPGMLLTAQELLAQRRRAEPRENPRADFRQLLPLHRLPGHRRCHRGGGAGARGRQTMKIVDDSPPILTALDRPNSYIGRSVPRPNLARLMQGRAQYRQRRGAAAHGACRLRALAARARQDQEHRRGRGEEGAGRDRRRHRRGACQGHHALGRRADASQGHQVGAAARHRGRPRLLGRRSGLRRGRAHPRRGRGRLRAGRRSTTRNCRPSPIRRPRSIRRRR